jgi:hypothetical protein
MTQVAKNIKLPGDISFITNLMRVLTPALKISGFFEFH